MFIGNRKKEYKLFKKLLWKLFCNFFNKNKLKIMHCLCRPSRIMSVRINLLDETDFIHEIKDDLPGQALLDVVFARLNLIETSYFGIRYIDEENQTHWLDPASRISRQLKPKADPYDLYFGVKFYAADPCKLVEEITRYQLFLQVKQDVLQGRLPVAFELAAELAELGDYDQRRHSKGYVSEFRLLPNQSSELETRVAELHQQLKGMSPAAAELNYLDKVKWHDMYGVDLHPVLGEDSVEYFLGLTPSGIVVLRNKTTVAHYYWPRIAKVYYKGRYFMLRISDKNNELSTYGFETPRKSACKHLWRCCVEHHAFFRLMRVPPTLPNSPTNTSDIFQLGSRLKCSKEKSSKDSLFINRSPPAFVRVPSKRQPRRIMDDFLNGCKKSEQFGGSSAFLNAKNASNYESPYRSTYSIPTSLGINPYHQQSQHTMPHSQSNYNNSNGVGGSHIQTPDSPRSTRSAPWPRSQQRSLFGNKPSSPRSVRSASTTGGGGANGVDGRGGSSNHHHHHSQHNTHSRSSQRDHVTSANGTTNSQQQQRYRSSSVESHSSNDSRSTRRHKHRHRRTSDNESELSRGSGRSARSHHRKHRRSRHRRDSAGSEHESTRGRSYSGHRSSTARSASAVGSHSELIDSSSQWREAQRRQQEASLGQSSVQQASVSKSNTAGMTEDQLREIPYTVVETNSKRSNSNIRIHKSNSKNSVGGKSTGSGNTLTNGSGSISGHGKNRVDRIRGLCYQNSNPNDSNGAKNGSIRSASTVSSRECDRNSGLVRMMSSMSMGDFISPTGSNLSPMENSALRVSHEHTDSGLGADQDYAYSSERSSDSTRYGTNKSSGASSGSHRKSSITHSNIMNGVGGGGSNGGGVGNTSAYNSLMQQTPMQQQQHHQQQPQQSAQTQQQQQQLLDKGADKSKPSHRLLNYTTFENNQYKFSLNNVFEWPNTPAAPYYYQGPSTVAMQAKKRDAKSDLGFPTRRLSGQCITKTQLLTGGGHLAPLSGMGYSMSGSQYPGYGSRLHPAKSDLFLAYPTTNEYEPPFIYNYKMPQMPEFLRSTQQQAQQQQQQQQQPTAYHISGSQTADPSLPPNVYKTTNNSTPAAYGGATPATDVMYYQFDNTACSSKASQPIVQQPKSLYNAKTTSQTGPTTTASPSHNMGPLVFLQHQQNVNGSTPTNANISSNVATTSNNSMQQTVKIDEEPSHNLDNEDDEDLYDGEVSYDEYDDGCLISHVNNNEQLSLTKDTNVIEASRTSSLASPTIRHLSSLAHHINLDNSNVNNNNNQQQQEPEHVRQHQQQQNLLSPNANTNLKSITNSLTPSNNSNPSTISNHSLHTNKPVITTQPTSPTLVKTSNCNNTCSNSGSSHNMQQNSHHNHLQQQQQLNHNNSSLQQIENLPPNTNTNSNFNLNSTHTSAPYTNSPLTYTSFNINNTSITNTQTQANIAATAATALQQSSSTTTTISCTAIATTATTTLSSSPLHSTTRSIQNQLQNQNQNISSSLEIILSPIIQSSRRRAQS
ncbi:Band 4.1-like protein 4 [Lucilia cuprina]|nr:Band 4.1-like protein 4 [Lucilia cuprina]